MMRLTSSVTLFILMVILTGLLLVGCSPRVVSTDDIKSTATIIPFNWTPKMDCAFCHTIEAASLNVETTASFHSEQDCIICHDDSAVISEAHADITMEDNQPTKLSNAAEISDGLCESCHSLETLSQATLGSTVLTDENGTTVNPHVLPGSHLGQRVSCTDCHIVHKTTDITNRAPNTCISCHHENVYQCGTCHE